MVGWVVIVLPRLLSLHWQVQVVQNCGLAGIGQPEDQDLKVLFGAE